MSINSALLTGVSGLRANASALATLSDNIANVNTVGYKRNQTDFQTIVTAQQNRSSGAYNAGGVLATARQRVGEQGLLTRTTSNTDLGINGQGFFVATQKPENLTDTDARLFTRAGSFTVDEFGYMRNSAGLYLQGWPVSSTGEVRTDPSDLGLLESINVTAVGGAAEQTTRVGVNANLNDSQPLSAEAGAYNVATNSMAQYDPATNAGVRPDFEIQIPVSDSKGGKRTLMLSLLRVSDGATPPSPVPNQWHAELRAVPASDVVTGTGLSNGQIKTGIIAFTQDGRLDTAATTLFDDPNVAGNQFVPTLTFGASDAAAPGAGQVNWAPGLGINDQSVTIDIDDPTAGLTQFKSRSVVQSVTTDGTPFGNLVNVEVDEEGFVTGIFDNGATRRLAQVAIATFSNPEGLIAESGNAWRVSSASGTYNLKVAGTGGAGLISPSTLEASTVDLSSEFTGLITTQRAYSASSKIITTADEMLSELINTKR